MRILQLFLIVFTFSCTPESNEKDDQIDFQSQMLSVPTQSSVASNLFVSSKGKAYLSWVEHQNDSTDALYFTVLKEDKWQSPQLIASGTNWFVNWADFPALSTFGEEESGLAAHWLQKRAEGTYDYDVHITMSRNEGFQWSPSFIPHTDGIAAEHGFVTMMPMPNGRVFATWLDGRNTKSEPASASDDHGHHGGGAMSLRTAEFNNSAELFEEQELDHRICDCCQTDAALTTNGPIVVYRDRSEEEIRDISIVRKVKGQWTAPQSVYPDNWKIAGCPVNGPTVATQGNEVAVAWFTAPENKGEVKVVFSVDGGATFSDPVRVDGGNPLGRVDIVFTAPGEVLVSWIEQKNDKGSIELARLTAKGLVGDSWTAAPITLSRQSGFPVMEKYESGYLLTWTGVDSLTTIKTMAFSFLH